jgi:hypothetical protein
MVSSTLMGISREERRKNNLNRIKIKELPHRSSLTVQSHRRLS